MTTTIRKATLNDIPTIRTMAEKVFPDTYQTIITREQCEYMMDMMYSEASLRHQMTVEHHTYLLLFVDDKPAGYVSVQPIEADRYELQKIYVLPLYQYQHLGTQLFDAAVAFVKEQHPEPCTLFLHVNRHNRAKHFYSRQGMKVTSQGDFSIGKGFFMNDYIMEKNI